MNYQKLLPKRQGAQSVNDWAESWLAEIREDLQGVIADDHPEEMRSRNERLSSYTQTLSTLVAMYQQHVDRQKSEYATRCPKPKSGITEWREQLDAELSPARIARDLLIQTHANVLQRISTAQSNLKSKAGERYDP